MAQQCQYKITNYPSKSWHRKSQATSYGGGQTHCDSLPIMEAIARHAPECPKPVAKEVVPRFTKIINLHTFSRKSGAPASRMFEIYAYLRLNQTILFDKGRYLYFHAITSMTWQPSLQERLYCEQQNEKKQHRKLALGARAPCRIPIRIKQDSCNYLDLQVAN